MEEEGPVAYLNSRYVSHERHRHNLEPCPVRIDRNIEDWETSFRFVWEDHVDATAPVKILLVQPTPPLIVFQGTVGHILIVQHPLPDHVACVVTGIMGHLPLARIVEFCSLI